MKRVHLEQVSRHFGRYFALHRVSMNLDAGTLTAIVGANGAGKTTLLNILATLDRPSSGEVLYDKYSWKVFSKQARHLVGWVSHAPLVYEDLSGLENLHFYASMYGIDAPEDKAREWLHRVGLADAMEHRVDTYSRGMVQRLTIARALMHSPELLLLDEPLTGLDREGRSDIAALFDEQRARGCILVMTTHDLHTLGGLCDRMVIMRKGKLVHDSSPENAEQVIRAYEEHA